MRLSARDFLCEVRLAPDSVRPIRLRAGGLTYCLDAAEAVALATRLADAVAELNTTTRKVQS